MDWSVTNEVVDLPRTTNKPCLVHREPDPAHRLVDNFLVPKVPSLPCPLARRGSRTTLGPAR